MILGEDLFRTELTELHKTVLKRIQNEQYGASAHVQPAIRRHSMWDLLLKNGRVIDPLNGRDGIFDIAVELWKTAPAFLSFRASLMRTCISAVFTVRLTAHA